MRLTSKLKRQIRRPARGDEGDAGGGLKQNEAIRKKHLANDNMARGNLKKKKRIRGEKKKLARGSDVHVRHLSNRDREHCTQETSRAEMQSGIARGEGTLK